VKSVRVRVSAIPTISGARAGKRERDLPLDPDLTVEVLVEREPVEGLLVDQVRDPVRPPVAGSFDDLEDAVAVLGEVLKAVGLPDELEERLRVRERLTSHCA
jgi:hypothetical protein